MKRTQSYQIAIDGMLVMQRSANIERLWRMPAILFLLIEQCDIAAEIPFVFEASDNGDTARLRFHRFCPISTSSNEAPWSANHQYLLLGSTFALIFALGVASAAIFPHRLRTGSTAADAAAHREPSEGGACW
ncbi:hypothetical protein OKW40_005958 [Paraburkholderia sp. RAU6.4a]